MEHLTTLCQYDASLSRDYAESHYAECHYAERRGALMLYVVKLFFLRQEKIS